LIIIQPIKNFTFVTKPEGPSLSRQNSTIWLLLQASSFIAYVKIFSVQLRMHSNRW